MEYLVDWEDIPENAFKGFREGVPDRLREYLTCLKDKGMSKGNAAAKAGIAYSTVKTARRNTEFCRLEKMAEKIPHAIVQDALYTKAKKGNLGHIVFFHKTRMGYVEKQQVETKDKSPDFNIDDCNERELKQLATMRKRHDKLKNDDQ